MILGICAEVLSRQLADEFKAWTPRITEWLVVRAVKRLPSSERDRYLEEWQSHINEIPGEVGKIIVGLQLLPAARKMSSSMRKQAKEDNASDLTSAALAFSFATLSIITAAPAMILIALIIKLGSRGPCLNRQERIGRGGRKFWLYSFRTLKELEPKSTKEHDLGSSSYRMTKIGRFLRAEIAR